jgi:hypothetical protein
MPIVRRHETQFVLGNVSWKDVLLIRQACCSKRLIARYVVCLGPMFDNSSGSGV